MAQSFLKTDCKSGLVGKLIGGKTVGLDLRMSFAAPYKAKSRPEKEGRERGHNIFIILEKKVFGLGF